MSNIFVLYRHIRPDKNQVFYIGIGTHARAYDFNWGRNRHWKAIHKLNNDQTEVEVMLDELSWSEACTLEKWWIAFYGRADLGKGPLCNLTDGGEGAYGRIKSPETIAKFKNTLQSKGEHHRKNIPHTQECRERIRKSLEGKSRPPEVIAKIKANRIWTEHTQDSKNRMSEKRKGSIPHNRKRIINTITGIEYDSVLKTAVNNSIPRTTMLRWITNNTNGYKFI